MIEHQKQTWTLTQDQVLKVLDTPLETGLSQAEAERRLAEYGPNELTEQGLRSPWRILAAQFTEVMVIVLIVAAAISLSPESRRINQVVPERPSAVIISGCRRGV